MSDQIERETHKVSRFYMVEVAFLVEADSDQDWSYLDLDESVEDAERDFEKEIERTAVVYHNLEVDAVVTIRANNSRS